MMGSVVWACAGGRASGGGGGGLGLLDGGFLGGKRKEGRGRERGRKGRFARSIEASEGGMEEERSQLAQLPLLYYTTAENGRKE